MEKTSITADIKEKAHALGYDLCGVIPVDSLKDYSTYLDKRVERFPKSRHLYEKLYDLGSPEKKEKWAKSIVVCVRRYNKYKIPPEISKYFGKVYLFDGRLPYSEEYKSAVLLKNTSEIWEWRFLRTPRQPDGRRSKRVLDSSARTTFFIPHTGRGCG